MREQNPLNARQPANEHRRVLGGRSLIFSRLVVSCLNVEILFIFLFSQSTERVVKACKGSSATKSSCVSSFSLRCLTALNCQFIDFVFCSLSECAKIVELLQSQS